MADKQRLRDFLKIEACAADVVELYNEICSKRVIYYMNDFNAAIKKSYSPGELSIMLQKSDHFSYEEDAFFIFTKNNSLLSFNSIFDDIGRLHDDLGMDFFITWVLNLDDKKLHYLEGYMFKDSDFPTKLKSIIRGE